ncbi:MAG: AAA family ATPase [Phycisphaeraceae bacterium]|nr:AAA family ATPase [Phycisphaeraceae bacterium]
MTVDEVAKALKDNPAKILLAYGFNSTGKTKLSVAFKNATKSADGKHAGVYYNAYSEDLFPWNNDTEHGEANIRMMVNHCSLNRLHSQISEQDVHEKLKPFRPKYDFRFTPHRDPERGIESITFVPAGVKDAPTIKISRGEERIFVWCFFLALFEVEGWADKQSSHFFIDDPVSSLDDHNIFVTASTLLDLIESQFENRKIIVTTHHIGLFSILADWLTKGEKADKFKKHTKMFILSDRSGSLELEDCREDVLLYHLRLLQLLERAHMANNIRAYHLALLRQVLENVASFLGVGQFRYVLEQIGIEDPGEVANIINVLSHKRVYYYESDMLVPDSREIFDNVFGRLKDHYKFKLHAE